MGAGPIPVSEHGLYPAEHRALRELYAFTRQLGGHWAKLESKLDDPPEPLGRGVAASKELLAELAERTAAYGLHGVPAATGAGIWVSRARGASDLFFERNQAVRAAVFDVQHVTTLLSYLAAVADQRSDTALAAWLRGWETRLLAIESDMRAAAVAEGADPERAIEPYDGSKLGRGAHAIGVKLGTLGEAYDARAAR
jgi:hypothetical protein